VLRSRIHMRWKSLILILLQSVSAGGADWPRFRGPNGSGISQATGLPVEFGPKKNVTWRSTIPPGGSSPVVTGNRLFLTGYGDKSLFTLCFDALSGKLLWRSEVERARIERRTAPNDPATPSPVSDGVNVYTLFPEFGLLSYTADGRERWRVPLPPFNPPHGMATSPILAGGNIILATDQISGSFVAAFRASDGKLVWKTPRPGLVGGYSTPILYEPPSETAQVLVSSPLELAAYSAATGEKLWSAERMGVMPISVPVLGDQLVFVNNEAVPPFEDLAITFKADKNRDGRLTPEEFPDPAFSEAVLSIDRVYGNGDGAIDAPEWNGALRLMQGMNALVAVQPGVGVAPELREQWRLTKGLPDVPSPLFYKGVLYLVKNGGIVTALDPKTGDILKQTRLQGAFDKFFASPVGADGKIYLTSESGKIAVVSASRELNLLAVNDLGEECYATPAIAHAGVYVRTREAVYYFSTN
jgi:outer membrane protein assembly factor BamB